MSSKVISFSVWGKNCGYLLGAIQNAKLARTLFPSYETRFYCADDVPQKVIESLEAENAEVIMKRTSIGYQGLFWRMEVADDPAVERFIIRDTDSRLTPRDAVMVKEWEESGLPAHIIRDCESHGARMLGATWGLVRSFIPDFEGLLREYWEDHYEGGEAEYGAYLNLGKGRGYGLDQLFLNAMVWPLIENHHLAHIAPYECLKFTGKEKEAPPLERMADMSKAPEPYVGMVCNLEKEYDNYEY